jgi:hypothetical protein
VKHSVVTLACALLAVSAGACADDRSSDSAAHEAANLTVRFTHSREPVVRYRCSSEPGASLPRCDRRKLARLASVLDRQRRRDRACAQLYGGPQRAHLTGTLRGKRVSARFTRVDGCAIADYDALRAVLGRGPAPTPGSAGSDGIAPPDAGTARGHGADASRIAVPESDASPPTATIVLATAGDGRTLAEVSQPPSPPPPGIVRLQEPRLQGTTIGTDDDGGVARVRVSIKERLTCKRAGGERFTRIRTRYFPPPQVERIRATPGTLLSTSARRSRRLTLAEARCGRGARAVEVHGELWGEAINGSGLEAVTRHIAFDFRADR